MNTNLTDMRNLPNNIEALLCWGKQQLEGVESASLDCRLLLSKCLDCNQAYLLTWPDKEVEQHNIDRFTKLINLRRTGNPVAHLLGYRDFWTLRLKVNPSTLIPRPETELLVEQALSLSLPKEARVLDLGTGTGAIALALASERPNWQITAVDKEQEAVALAKDNANQLGLERVKILQSDWFSALNQERYDVIISNPPYIEASNHYLQEGDVRFEPLSALTSGEDGLDDIRHIIKMSVNKLTDNGWLLLEHGYNQAQKVQDIMHNNGLIDVNSEIDTNQHPRITYSRKSH